MARLDFGKRGRNMSDLIIWMALIALVLKIEFPLMKS